MCLHVTTLGKYSAAVISFEHETLFWEKQLLGYHSPKALQWAVFCCACKLLLGLNLFFFAVDWFVQVIAHFGFMWFSTFNNFPTVQIRTYIALGSLYGNYGTVGAFGRIIQQVCISLVLWDLAQIRLPTLQISE